MKVVAKKLRDHADSIDDAIDAFKLSEAASKHVKAGNDAFGTLCQWLPPILDAKRDRLDGLMKKAKDILTDDAKAMRTMADEYETTDKDNAVEVEKTIGDLKDVGWV